MNEIDRLKMQVEHYENKEKNLIKWLNDVIEMVEYKEKNVDAYDVRMHWNFYQRALLKVLEKINELERV